MERVWREFWECVDMVWGECGEGVDRFGDSADIVLGESGEVLREF